MATIKHLAIKNSSYAFPLRYLTYQYDEHTNKPILDENKHMMLRDEYLIDAIGVLSPSTFQAECESWNEQCGKNNKHNEIKLHHYIISFDPKDKEKGLTPEKVQSLGMEIAKKYFKGCQALVCTHPDGHNNFGNIHIHLIVNSVRKDTIEKQDFIERENECKSGSKFRNSKLFLNAIRTGVMAICERENLNQVDLINPAQVKISEREYRKQQREQKKLDVTNAQMESEGIVPAKKIYQTEKDKIRKAVRRIIHIAANEDELKKLLEEEGIYITVSRGRWAYKTDNLSKPIRARQFGTTFEKEYVLNQLGNIGTIKDIPGKYYGNVRKQIKVQNAINAANTMNFFIKNNISGPEELLTRYNEAKNDYNRMNTIRNSKQEKLTITNRLIHNTGSYLANKRIYNAWLQVPDSQKEEYMSRFSSELHDYKLATEQLEIDLKAAGITTIPELNTLKEEKKKLQDEITQIDTELVQKKIVYDELGVIKNNYEKLMDLEIEDNNEVKNRKKNNVSLE